MPHDFISMWNLKNKTKEQVKQKKTHSYREKTRVVGGGDGGSETGERD